jgi:signal transduction histidine kinase
VDAHRNGDSTIQISVSDTGVGIAPEHLSHIFDEFFQLRNPERDRAKGSGLGLTICKRLVDAMGGTLDVRSAPGSGSTFVLTLPAYAIVPTMPAKPPS